MNILKKLLTIGLWLIGIVLVYLALLFVSGNLEFPIAYPLSDKTVAIIKTATRVETFEVQNDLGFDTTSSTDGYTITKTGPVETGEYVKRLQDVLLSRWTFYRDSSKCIPEPPVMYRLVSPEGTVDVLPCFECGILQVFTRTGKEVQPDASWFGMGNRPKLLALAKEAFPKDPEIQSIR